MSSATVPAPTGARLMLAIANGTPVRVLHAGDGPLYIGAEVTRADGDELELDLTNSDDVRVGSRLILELPPPAPPRAVVVVLARAGTRIATRVVRLPTVDRREYPRLWGTVGLRYRLAGPELADAWMRGAEFGGTEYVPDPRMDVSATGLAFEDLPRVSEGDCLLATVTLPGEGRGWRCVGRVVRVLAIPKQERAMGGSATHRIAMFFDAIPDDATAALVRYTARLQEAMVLGLAPRGAVAS